MRKGQEIPTRIRSKVDMFELLTWAVVQKAMIIEGEIEQYNRDKEGKKRKTEFQGVSQGHGSNQGQSTKKTRFQQGRNVGFRRPEIRHAKQGGQQPNVNQPRLPRPPLPDCRVCGKMHIGVCFKANIVCVKCNQKGYYANECKSQKPPVFCNRCGKPGHIAKNCRAAIPAMPTSNMLRIAAPTQTSKMLKIEGPSSENQPRARPLT